MSIVRLDKVTFLGLTEDRARLLEDMQALGCLHIEPLAEENGGQDTLPPVTAGSREALRFLHDCPQMRRQIGDSDSFDALETERKVLDVRQRLQDLSDERDFLVKRIQDMRPWGDFTFSPLPEMGGLRLWFYLVPHREMPLIQSLPLTYQIVRTDNRHSYVVVVSATEPEGMPVNRSRIGNRSRHELETRLEQVEMAIEDARAERAYLTRWYSLLRDNIATLEDRAALEAAQHQIYNRAGMFALRGWAPQLQRQQLEDYAHRHGVHLDIQEVQADDMPPTYLHNPEWLAAGEDLVNFYMTPGYRTWDPSPVVFISFALFFAMILADAGYALFLGALLLSFWRKMGVASGGRRFRPLCVVIVGFSVLYGMLIGSYFGVAPAKGSFLSVFHVLDMSDSNLMMQISVFIGCVHVILGAALDAARYPNRVEGLASIGWACIVSAGLLLLLATAFAPAVLKPLSLSLAGMGVVLVLWFTAPFEKPLPRLLKGLLGMTKLSGAFGDVLSYLRLFALGLASGSLAAEFNHMASGIHEAMPGLGLFLAILVLLLGHAVNLLLGLASALIHGLRLNVIEFFNWGLKEEGMLFKPFRRTER
ncbi:ATPase V [Methylomonas sp. LL1]|uniref:V-type ATP synthase subunit I n=1 Tax=Methylomonas sp. LL1 TaxID=2785785 RepID=UPI0018C3A75E|nr:V-type ATPase 116kDa subunit family protein [Methylomonas sp. LL1]QPK63546.1 ATPase V [Methylomonas sp. LL1]